MRYGHKIGARRNFVFGNRDKILYLKTVEGMDYKTRVNVLLEGVSKRLGFALKFDEKGGTCHFRDNASQRHYVLEVLEHHDMLYIYCPLLEVPADKRETFFHFLLTLNLHGLMTRHAFVGLDEVKNLIVMSYSFPIDLLNETLLFNMIVNFTSSAEKVYSILDNFLKSNSYVKGMGLSRRNDVAKISKFKMRI
ncbi:MAG: type III secretion system chaperone [Puniceicoccales bacterium]|nr:type III secretion system chaperone [Puniceicoccales bacterium]